MMPKPQDPKPDAAPAHEPDSWRTRLTRSACLSGCSWWVLFGALLLWNISGLWTGAEARITLPYSTFLEQVRAGNVANVEFNGDQIQGHFVQPITGTPTLAGTGTAAVSPVATPAKPPAIYPAFQTTYPAAVNDPTLLPLLAAHGVEIAAQSQAAPWYSGLLSILWMVLPLLLLVGLMVYLGRQTTQGSAGIFSFGRTKARVYDDEKGTRPTVTFADVAGADEAKDDLQEVVDFLQHPDKYRSVGAHMPRGILLVGPPGTGKTLLAKAVAGEAGVPFFSISASEFVEMLVGVGASRVRDLFDQARQAAPAIVFIDELDAVGRRRGTGLGTVNDEREQTLNQLLVALDGFEENQAVIVLAATNRPDVLDPALLRPGRFDRQVVVSLPDRVGRQAILRIHTRDLPLAPGVDLAGLAHDTTGFSGADLANLCNEAALQTAAHNRALVTTEDFRNALDKLVLGDKRHVLLGPDDRRVVAAHEAGHVLVAWVTPLADEVQRVTVIPHGRALGVTEQRPADDQYNYSRHYLLDRVAVMMGGRAAEALVLGDVTTGAENDLHEATQLARRMVTEWGMSDLGLAALETDSAQPFLGYELAQGHNYSDATAAQVDAAVETLLADRYAYARSVLEAHRADLDGLIAALLQDDTVDRERLVQLLGPRPVAAPVAEAAPPVAGFAVTEPGRPVDLPVPSATSRWR